MPIKKISVAFELDMDVFMQILSHAPANVRFEAHGTDVPLKLSKAAQRLLPPPREKKSRAPTGEGAKQLILNYLLEHKDHPVPVKELAGYLASKGYALGTSSSQLAVLKSRGFVKSPKPGFAQATAKAATVGATTNGK